MKISKTHENFADLLKKQEVLTHPENYLGPNWEEVINFWLYLDTLSYEQLRVAGNRYLALSFEEWIVARKNARDIAEDVTNYTDDATAAVYSSVSYAKSPAEYATLELIGLDKLLEQGHQPVFFPMFLNPF
jgi:hypothetical protein